MYSVPSSSMTTSSWVNWPMFAIARSTMSCTSCVCSTGASTIAWAAVMDSSTDASGAMMSATVGVGACTGAVKGDRGWPTCDGENLSAAIWLALSSNDAPSTWRYISLATMSAGVFGALDSAPPAAPISPPVPAPKPAATPTPSIARCVGSIKATASLANFLPPPSSVPSWNVSPNPAVPTRVKKPPDNLPPAMIFSKASPIGIMFVAMEIAPAFNEASRDNPRETACLAASGLPYLISAA